MTTANLTEFIHVRVSKSTRKAFEKKVQRYGKPSDVMREIIEAFVDGRLEIKPDPKKESLYVS